MRLSVVFELLLVFLFLAFAAARVIDKKNVATAVQNPKKLRQGGPNRYCACTTNLCNCCRDFSLPVVPIKGPGCASIMYLKGDNMMISMSFGDRVLSNMTLAGPKPKPVCMNLPGGISQFCGRVYGISRTEKNFKACLGLELRALDDIEAALRVSCFKFGPKGVNLESAPPIPIDEPDDEDDEDEDDYDLGDDDDDDLIGLGGDLDDDDDDDDDEDDDDGPNVVSSNEGNEVDSDSADYAGFSVLGEDLFGTFFTDEESKPKKKKKEPVKKTVKPAISLAKLSTTTRRPIFPVKRPTVRPTKITRRPTNKVTLLPRPSINRIVSSTSAPTSVSQVISMAPLPPVSIPPIKDPIPTSMPSATLSGSTHTYSTTEKHQMTPSQPIPTIPSTQIIYTYEKLDEVNSVQAATDRPTLVKIPLPTDEVKLPELDLEKIEAMAAIAQQGVTSSVLHSSALPPKESQKIPVAEKVVTEEINTEKYVLVPSIPMLKGGSPPKESEEDEDDEEDDDLLDGIIDDGLDNDEETSGSEEDNEAQSSNDSSQEVKPQTVRLNETLETEKDEMEEGMETEKPTKVKLPEKSEDDEEESDDDFFDGIIDDDDEEEEDDEKKKGDNEEDKEENVKEEEEEEDILGAFVADPYENDNEKEESIESTENDKEKESEEESEEDLLNVLGDDDEEQDNSAEEVDDGENNKPTLKNKNGNKPHTVMSEKGNAEETDTDKVYPENDKHDKSSASSSSSSSSSEEDIPGDGLALNGTTTANKVDPTTPSKTETTTPSNPDTTTPRKTEMSTSDPGETTEPTDMPSTVSDAGETTMQPNNTEIGRYERIDFIPLPKSDTLLLMKAAAKIKEPQVLRIGDFLGPRKKYLKESDKPISTSRTHRRMNLDRWAPI